MNMLHLQSDAYLDYLRLKAMEESRLFTPNELHEALRALEARIGHLSLPELFEPRRWRSDGSTGVLSSTAITISRHGAAEVWLLSLTGQSAQFSINTRGATFLGFKNGRHEEIQRIYIDGVCPALDEISALISHFKGRSGGRFYVDVRQREIRERKHGFRVTGLVISDDHAQ